MLVYVSFDAKVNVSFLQFVADDMANTENRWDVRHEVGI